MRVSYEWLSSLLDSKKLPGPDAMAALLTARGLEAEEVLDLSKGFENVVTAKIVKKEKHPNADRLSFCTVTLGKGESLGIVCGATNMQEGDTVALAQPGAKLPNGIEIKKSAIRGVESQGMLCSEEELGIKEKADGILILPPGTPLGVELSEILGRNDTVFTFNVTPNRGDCLSHLGMAREVSAALSCKIKLPKLAKLPPNKSGKIKLELKAGNDGFQFYGCGIEGVKVSPSPEWLVKRLQAVGQRSINNIVDATNYVMLELGHPVHAYDWDKITGGRLGIRLAQKGESLKLLDDSLIELEGSELVIADGKSLERPVALAGVMGGLESAVSESTTRIYLECAEFAPGEVRKAAKVHVKHTDAAYRFERGIDPKNLGQVVGRLVALILESTDGKVSEFSFSQLASRSVKSKTLPRKISFSPKFVSDRLGFEVPAPQSKKMLSSLGFKISGGAKWNVVVPTHRNDIEIPEDLVEEVGRSIGFDKIPAHAPKLSSFPDATERSTVLLEGELIERAKRTLAALGFHETVHFAFTSRAWLSKFSLESKLKILNPLSEEQEVLVPSLLPGLIQTASENWNRHFGSHLPGLRFFELRPTFHFKEGESTVSAKSEHETGVVEDLRLSLLFSGEKFLESMKTEEKEVDFSDLKGVMEHLFSVLGAKGFRFAAFDAREAAFPKGFPEKAFHPGQSARIELRGETIGAFGLIHPSLNESLELKRRVWLCEMSFSKLLPALLSVFQPKQFQAWPEFPGMERDFALLVDRGVLAEEIVRIAQKQGQPLLKNAYIFDTYAGDKVPPGKQSVAIRLLFQDFTRSVQEAEISQLAEKILEKWKKDLSAELRS